MNNFNAQACIDCSNSFAEAGSPPPCFLAHGRALAFTTQTLVFVNLDDLYTYNGCYWAVTSEADFRTYALGYDVDKQERMIPPMRFFDYHLDRNNAEQHFLRENPTKLAAAAHIIRTLGVNRYPRLNLPFPDDDSQRFMFRQDIGMYTKGSTLILDYQAAVLGVPDRSNRPNYHNRMTNLQDENHVDIIDPTTNKPKRVTVAQDLAASDKRYYPSFPDPTWGYFVQNYFRLVTPYLNGEVQTEYKITGGSSFSGQVGSQHVPGAQYAGISGTLVVKRKGTGDTAEFKYSGLAPAASIPFLPSIPFLLTGSWSPSIAPSFFGQIYLGMEATDSIHADDLQGTAVIKDWGAEVGVGGDLVTWYFGVNDATASAVAAERNFGGDFQVPCKAYANVLGFAIGLTTSPKSVTTVDVVLTKR